VNNFGAWNELRGRCLNFNACNISNGVDLETFRPMNNPLCNRRKVLWTASRSKAESEDDIKGYQRIIGPLEKVLPHKGFETDFMIADGAGLKPEGMRHWYASAGIYVQTSQSEGTPNTLLEAMACGMAVVTSNVGNVPELIVNGVNGVIVDDWQTIPFLEGIQKADAMREELSFNALRSIISWDWRKRVEWYYAVLRKVAAGERPGAFTYLDTSPGDV
jgi:glycosyltransferase involved in cell wall biosynthesis